MADFIHAPLPYIVGWSSNVFKTIHSRLHDEIDNEIVVLDFDTNKIVWWKSKVKFPNPQTEYCKLKYEDLLKSVTKLKELSNYDNFNFKLDLSDNSRNWLKHQIMINLQINMRIK